MKNIKFNSDNPKIILDKLPFELRIILAEIYENIQIAQDHHLGKNNIFIKGGKKVLKLNLTRLQQINSTHNNPQVTKFIEKMKAELGIKTKTRKNILGAFISKLLNSK